MSVRRISTPALNKLLKGEVKEDSVCLIKFYSNNCHLCHNLKEYYEDLSEVDEYKDIHFFAFNIEDYPQMEKKLNFNGVPTISLIKTYVDEKKPMVRVLSDPDKPNEQTWYRIKDIRNFIKEER
ncbi:MAG: hypothetical protein CMC82_04510 [Flavobacteriaceae bacterium]|nr:hypothetical protein [Flavobacteriaceae bacterium]